MLSSLGFDTKGSSRSARNVSKVLEVPRGFSVHVFKNTTHSTQSQSVAGTQDRGHTRAPVGITWPKPTSHKTWESPGRERKHSLTTASADYRKSSSFYERALEPKTSKSSRSYGIYPSAVPDLYIYERSLSSVSDILNDSSSSSSSDSDTVSDSASFSVEISSIRARGSTETLETTALGIPDRLLAIGNSSDTAPVRTVDPTSALTQVGVEAVQYVRSRTDSSAGTSSNRLAALLPGARARSHRPTVETVSDNESDDTVVTSPQLMHHTAIGVAPAAPHPQYMRDIVSPPDLSHPARRNSSDRQMSPEAAYTAGSAGRDSSSGTAPSLSAEIRAEQFRDGGMSIRAPPGLSSFAPQRDGGVRPRTRSGSSSSLSETRTARVLERSPELVSCVGMEGALVEPTKRCVRWTENLVCPSPIPVSQRRKGWFNCRGDQLWTNDGKYKPPLEGQEFPPDLMGYPQPNAGWMNEEGVRIDLQHHLIPKPPLRSALKRSKSPIAVSP